MYVYSRSECLKRRSCVVKEMLDVCEKKLSLQKRKHGRGSRICATAVSFNIFCDVLPLRVCWTFCATGSLFQTGNTKERTRGRVNDQSVSQTVDYCRCRCLCLRLRLRVVLILEQCVLLQTRRLVVHEFLCVTLTRWNTACKTKSHRNLEFKAANLFSAWK